MSKNKVYKGCYVAPNSKLYELMETAEKTKKVEDQRAVIDHYDAVHAKFIEQCGLPKGYVSRHWSIGRADA